MAKSVTARYGDLLYANRQREARRHAELLHMHLRVHNGALCVDGELQQLHMQKEGAHELVY